MRQELFKPLDLGIYFQISRSSGGNVTIACTGVSRLIQVCLWAGSWAEAAKRGT